jgi:hypothetical protein
MDIGHIETDVPYPRVARRPLLDRSRHRVRVSEYFDVNLPRPETRRPSSRADHADHLFEGRVTGVEPELKTLLEPEQIPVEAQQTIHVRGGKGNVMHSVDHYALPAGG